MRGMAVRMKPKRYWSSEFIGDEGEPFPSQLRVRGARSYFDVLQKSGAAPLPTPRVGIFSSLRSWFARLAFGR